MDQAEISRWFRAASGLGMLGSATSLADTPASVNASTGLYPGMTSPLPPSGIHLPTAGSSTFLPGGGSTDHRDLLSPSVYQAYMWPTLLPHPDLLMQSSPLASHRLPASSPLLLGDTCPPPPYLPPPQALLPTDVIHPWHSTLTSPTLNKPSNKKTTGGSGGSHGNSSHGAANNPTKSVTGGKTPTKATQGSMKVDEKLYSPNRVDNSKTKVRQSELVTGQQTDTEQNNNDDNNKGINKGTASEDKTSGKQHGNVSEKAQCKSELSGVGSKQSDEEGTTPGKRNTPLKESVVGNKGGELTSEGNTPPSKGELTSEGNTPPSKGSTPPDKGNIPPTKVSTPPSTRSTVSSNRPVNNVSNKARTSRCKSTVVNDVIDQCGKHPNHTSSSIARNSSSCTTAAITAADNAKQAGKKVGSCVRGSCAAGSPTGQQSSVCDSFNGNTSGKLLTIDDSGFTAHKKDSLSTVKSDNPTSQGNGNKTPTPAVKTGVIKQCVKGRRIKHGVKKGLIKQGVKKGNTKDTESSDTQLKGTEFKDILLLPLDKLNNANNDSDREKQDDTDDTEIDVGEEVTCTVSDSHHGDRVGCQGDVMDLTMSSGSSPVSGGRSSMKKNSSKLSSPTEGIIDSTPSVEKTLSQLPTSPNYMSFDPRILNFYTNEEREKLVQSGWIPSYYSTSANQNPSEGNGLELSKSFVTNSNQQNGNILSDNNNYQVPEKKQGHDGKKLLSRDKKKVSADGVVKKTSPPTTSTSTIPVGIAIARKRHDEREADRSSDQTQAGRSDSVIVPDRVTTTVTTTTSSGAPTSSRGLSSNLVITGGSNSGYWLGHGPYSLPPSTRDGAQLQYNPPPGYKIAGDPITGQLYVIPDMARGFGPTSPLPSPRSSIKSDQSLESAALELTALSPNTYHGSALSPNTHHGSPNNPQDYTRRSRSERPRSRDESHRNERPESRSGSEGQRSRSNQSTPTTVTSSRLLSPERAITPVTSTPSVHITSYRQGTTVAPPPVTTVAQPPGTTVAPPPPAHSYPYHYPYYTYYWGQPYPLTRPPSQSTGTAIATVTTAGKSPSNNNYTSQHIDVGVNTTNRPNRKTVSTQTASNPVTACGVQTVIDNVTIGVQTAENVSDNSEQNNARVDEKTGACNCKCHKTLEEKEVNLNDLDEAIVSEGRPSLNSQSSDANSDGLQILSALASHIDFFSPLTVSTDLSHSSSHSPDVSSVYNGPRSSYFDSNDIGQRRVKTPTSSVFRFGLDNMEPGEVELRSKLAEIQLMYKEKQKELGKLKPKKDSEQRRSVGSKGSRRSSKSLSDYDPLSPKPEPLVSPKPTTMRKTKAQLKYMPNQPVLEPTPPVENKDSDVEELRSLFEDTFLESNKEKSKERRLSLASKVADCSHEVKAQPFSSPNHPVTNDNKQTKISKPSDVKVLKSERSKPVKFERLTSLSSACNSDTTANNTKNDKRKRKGNQGNEQQSPAKKRKPGRPKKFRKKGITQTLVSKSTKQFSMFTFDSDDNRPSGTDSDNKTDSEHWDRRRSERIFLNDANSPTKIPGSPIETMNDTSKVIKERTRLNDLSHKLKKKYRSLDNNRSNKQNTEVKVDNEVIECKDVISVTSVKCETDNKRDVTTSAVIQSDLKDGLQILYFMDGLFYEGRLKEIHPPDVYGINLHGERGNRPHILSREEILQDVFHDVRVQDSQQVPIGTRICAYWSQQFTCMYPGLIVEGDIPLPKTARGRGLVNVEFDDGDTGKISVEHIRILPQDFPIQEDSDDEEESPAKRRKSMSEELLADSWRERRPAKVDTVYNFQVQSKHGKKIGDNKLCPSALSKVNKPSQAPASKNTPKTPSKKAVVNKKMEDSDTSSSSDSDDSDDNSGDESDSNNDGSNKKKKSGSKSPRKRSTSSSSSPKDKKQGKVKNLPAHQIWEWFGCSSKRPGSKGKAKKTFYKAIKRGDEVIKVGECAVFLTVGRPHLPYIGRVECFYESRGGVMVVKVKWFYHPEETKGGKKLMEIRGALYESPHCDENDVQTISHKCHVMSYTRYKSYRQGRSNEQMANVYYLAGFYDPTASLIKFEGDVKLI